MATFHEMTADRRAAGRALLRQGRPGRPDRPRRARIRHPGRDAWCRSPTTTATSPWRPTTGSPTPANGSWWSPSGTSTRPGSTRTADLHRPGPRPHAARDGRHRRPARAPRRRPRSPSATRPGIRVRMITGDHATTAAAIAGELGIEGRALTGTEFAAMSDDELLAELDEIGVIARVAPEDKIRLVRLLKQQGQRRRDDRRRRQRRARAQGRRHRRGHGDHRHRGLQGGRGHDPHRRQLRHDRRAPSPTAARSTTTC